MRLTPGPNLPLLLIPPLLCALLADLWLAGPWMFLLALALTALPALVDLLRLQRCQPEIRVERRLRRKGRCQDMGLLVLQRHPDRLQYRQHWSLGS